MAETGTVTPPEGAPAAEPEELETPTPAEEPEASPETVEGGEAEEGKPEGHQKPANERIQELANKSRQLEEKLAAQEAANKELAAKFEETRKTTELVTNELLKVDGIGNKVAETLIAMGIDSIQKLSVLTADQLSSFQGIGPKTAQKMVDGAKQFLADNPGYDGTSRPAEKPAAEAKESPAAEQPAPAEPTPAAKEGSTEASNDPEKNKE
mgnify:CR=1 FL=1